MKHLGSPAGMKNFKILIGLVVALGLAAGGFLYWRHQANEAAAILAAREAADRMQSVVEKGQKPPQVVEDEPEPVLAKRPDILELLEQNPDTVAYLKIEDTKVDYPVVQAADNEYYLTHTFEGAPSDWGAIFADASLERNQEELPRHILLHGHHMKDGSMFQNVSLYKGKNFFFDHPLIEYETLYYRTVWQVYSVSVVDSSEYVPMVFRSDEDFVAYAEKTAERSMFPVEVSFTAEDHIMTLNTCSYEFNGAHTLVCAKLVEIESDWEPVEGEPMK